MNGIVIWITGLSGAGKTTLAIELVNRLRVTVSKTIFLDGDELRKIFDSDISELDEYSRDSRLAMAFKYANLCKMLYSQGFSVVVATISMFDEIYEWNRQNITNYFEVFLKVPLVELRRRDPKSIYKRFDQGDLKNVAGLDLSVDQPLSAHLVLGSELQLLPIELAERVMVELNKKGKV